MVVRNMQLNETCHVEFKKRGWSGKGAFEVDGYAFSNTNSKDKKGHLWGKWIESLTYQQLNNGIPSGPEEVIW